MGKVANMSDKDTKKRLEMYHKLIAEAAEKRKAKITVRELAEKLEIQTSAIYRMEHGHLKDIKLSTLMGYLFAFGYKLAIVPDELVIVPNPKKLPKIEKEVFDKAKIDRRTRIRLLKYLIALEEAELGDQ